MDINKRCGFVALVGRPNVGKSTLLNRILGQKISITSQKPQTTREQILGIHTDKANQIVFLDTPGIHIEKKGKDKALNRYMNTSALNALESADLIVFMLDRTRFNEEDAHILKLIKTTKAPVILLLNKVDLIKDKPTLLPFISKIQEEHNFASIVPFSTKNEEQVEKLKDMIVGYLPHQEHFYPEDQVTNRSERFLIAEIIREKITRQLGEEVPYQATVEIEKFERKKGVLHLHALIWVGRKGQKKILIGDAGEKLKIIGRDARIDLEKMFETKVMLNLWVKVKKNWSDDLQAMKSLGYTDTQ